MPTVLSAPTAVHRELLLGHSARLSQQRVSASQRGASGAFHTIGLARGDTLPAASPQLLLHTEAITMQTQKRCSSEGRTTGFSSSRALAASAGCGKCPPPLRHPPGAGKHAALLQSLPSSPGDASALTGSL